MPAIHTNSSTHALLSRRSSLHVLAAGALGCVLAPARAGVEAPSAQVWRVLSRLGYGPTPALVDAVRQASSPRDWALAQLDAAYAASQQPAAIAPEWAAFNAPLPELFAGVREERALRQQRRQDADTPQTAAEEFATGDAAHFSRHRAQQAAAWRLASASQPELENPLLARLTEFWFNHLNVYVGKGPVRPFVGHYAVNVARAHALGKMEDLLLASARHPAMLYYLDQWQSVAEGTRGRAGAVRGLNENYARELMELHTLGVDGGYTQADVRALAQVLTGWTVGPNAPDGFRFASRWHSGGEKTVLGQTFGRSLWHRGEQEGEDAIRMLARQSATARRVCTRLAQFFIADNPDPMRLRGLFDAYMESQGDLRVVLRELLQSADFWQPENRLFKTPMDFACSALTACRDPQAALPEKQRLVHTLGFLANAGQPLHGWQTPDGYRFDAATWLVPEALTRRADYALALARKTPELDFLRPFLDANSLQEIDQDRAAERAGLMLASPAFMRK